MDILLNILAQLGVNSTIFIMIGLFIGTYVVVSRLAIRKVTATVVERSRRTEGRDHEVHDLRHELTTLNEQLESELKKVRTEAGETYADLKQKAVDDHRNILTDARQQATAQIKAAREDVEAKFATEMKKVREEVPNLARQILEQIAGGAGSKKKLSATSEVYK
jgi:F0F1-type ATP synthase membrane subunit b/b'